MNAFRERNILTKLPFPLIHIQIITAIFRAQIIIVIGYKKVDIDLLFSAPFTQ